MKLRDLQMFISVAELGSFTKAAEQLYIAQPALSRRIAEMERNLGCTLFLRNTRKVELSEAGQIFLRHTKAMMADYSAALREIGGLERSISGTLLCGYTPIGGQPSYLLEALRHLSISHSGIQVKMVRDYTPMLVDALKAEALDCCLVSTEAVLNETLLEYSNLHPIPYLLILPRSHPLAAARKVDFVRLASERLVLIAPEHAPLMYQDLADACRLSGFDANGALLVHDVDELLLYVRVGKGLGILTSSKPIETDQELLSIPLTGRVCLRNRALVWKKGGHNPCLPLFLNALREVLD